MPKTSPPFHLCIEVVIANKVGLLTRINDVCILLIVTVNKDC